MSKKSTIASDVAMPAGASMEVPLKLIVVDEKFNVRQIRDEDAIKHLATSMDHEGQINDVTLEPNGDGTFTLRAGYRRLSAAKLLGWDSIRATQWIPRDDKGNPITNEKDALVARYFVNIAENVARENITPYDLAHRCHEMSAKHDLTEDAIAKRLGKNRGYISTLIRIVGTGKKGDNAGNTLHPQLMQRWKEECTWKDDDKRMRICRINDLIRLAKCSHDEQMKWLDEELFVAGGGDREAYRQKLSEGADSTPANGGVGVANVDTKLRATPKMLAAALENAEFAKKSANKEETTRLNGVIDGLKFALGVKKGSTNRIRGVFAVKDGEIVEQALPPPEKEAPKAAKGAAKN